VAVLEADGRSNGRDRVRELSREWTARKLEAVYREVAGQEDGGERMQSSRARRVR
jgi:hypothetical protein